MPCISVIVPVYKVEAWLHPCVDSLLAQSFSDFELILVDDGSPDGCPAICDEYAVKDRRVRVIHRPNGGLSAARNSGIAAARGSYFAFVDSDDTVAPDYLAQLYRAITESNADMAVCGIENISEEGKTFSPRQTVQPVQEGVFSGRELMDHFFGEDCICYTVAWNKLYRASLWQELRYPEGMIHEDDAVAHLLYHRCSRVVCLAVPLYFYRMREGSISRTVPGAGTFDAVSSHALWCRFFAEELQDMALLNKALRGCWLRYLSLCFQAKQGPLTWPLCARWHSCQQEMRRLLPYLKSCTSLTRRQKLSCHLWAKRSLPLPPRTDKKRLALLLPPGLPVPPVAGGAVETLTGHLVEQNEIHKDLELAVVCQWDARAAAQACRYKNTLFYYLDPPGQTIRHRIHFHLSRLVLRPIHWNAWYTGPVRFLKQLNADLYSAEGGDLTGWMQASRKLGRNRFAAHLHGEATATPQLDRIYGRALAISDFVGKSWQQDTQRPVTLVPNCVNADRFCPGTAEDARRAAQLKQKLGFAPDDFVVLFCGRTCPEKGIHQLVNAMNHIRDKKIKLLVVGSPFFEAKSDSPYFTDLKAAAEKLGDRVRFTGFVHNSMLPDYYRLAGAACFPALWDEPAGITAIEAMACGCPIVATRSGGMPEYLQGSEAVLVPRSEIWQNGELVPVKGQPPLDRTLAEVLSILKEDRLQQARMKKAGPAAAARYTAEQYYRNMAAAVLPGKES